MRPRVLPARLVGDPGDRLDAVLARQVDSPEKFMRFLLLILGLTGGAALRAAGEGAGGDGCWASGNAAVFELLARALADNPGSLDDLGRIVDRLPAPRLVCAVMPEGFLALWSTVLEAQRPRRGAGMTEPFVAATHLARLKDFQRSTVRHVVDRMYDDPDPTRRFLVADETGLGKSVVARGVIAEAVERLLEGRQRRADRRRLRVLQRRHRRAEPLPAQRRRQQPRRVPHPADHAGGPVARPQQLGGGSSASPSTSSPSRPATSFEKGWRTGKSEERALLALMLQRHLDLRGARRTALHRVLQGGVRTPRALPGPSSSRTPTSPSTPTILKEFAERVREPPGSRETRAPARRHRLKRSLADEQLHERPPTSPGRCATCSPRPACTRSNPT